MIAARLRRAAIEARAALGGALRAMVAHRLRAFLSTLGIGIGVATLMAIFAIVQGLTASFNTQIAQLGAHTLYVSNRPWVTRGDWWRYRNRPPITHADVDALRRGAPLLTAVAPIATATAEVGARGERAGGVMVRGTSSDYAETANVKLDGGRFLSPLDDELATDVVVLGSDVRDALFRGASALGAQVRIGAHRFTVIGTLRPLGRAFGQPQDNVVVIPMSRFGRLFGARRDQVIAVAARPERLAAAEEQVVEVLRRGRRLGPAAEDDFSINRQSTLLRIFDEETSALFGVAIAVGLITLLVGGIGVMNIMLVAVTERTREIGVRRALGARRRTILVQFLIEASLVTLLGGAAGTAVGMGGAQLLALATPVAAAASPQAALLGLAFSGAVGLLFGTWPAYRAARLDPIEALRYE